jgi:transcriptional regulator with XRE-family HTH domain
LHLHNSSTERYTIQGALTERFAKRLQRKGRTGSIVWRVRAEREKGSTRKVLDVQNDGGVEIAIGQRIRALRERRGWSRARLSKLAEVSEVYISQIENGTRPRVGVNVLLGLARAFRVSLDELTGYDVSSLPPEQPQQFAQSDEQLAHLRDEVAQLRATMQQALLLAAQEREARAQAIEQVPDKPQRRTATGSPRKKAPRKGR